MTPPTIDQQVEWTIRSTTGLLLNQKQTVQQRSRSGETLWDLVNHYLTEKLTISYSKVIKCWMVGWQIWSNRCVMAGNQSSSPESGPMNSHSPVQELQKVSDVFVSVFPSSFPLFSSPYASVSSWFSCVGWPLWTKCSVPEPRQWWDTLHCCALRKDWGRHIKENCIQDKLFWSRSLNEFAVGRCEHHTCWWSSLGRQNKI